MFVMYITQSLIVSENFLQRISGCERTLKLSEKRWNPFPVDTNIDMSVTIVILNRGKGIREKPTFEAKKNYNRH